jgi:hypothetical protein
MMIDVHQHEAFEEYDIPPPLNDEEAEVERLLSEKLLQGYVLLETSCPSCATPLVKRNAPMENRVNAKPEEKLSSFPSPWLVPSESFDQPFRAVHGVPYCVACDAHVVTEEADISVLERCDSLKQKGTIMVALPALHGGGESAATPFTREEANEIESILDSVCSGKDASSFLCGTSSRQMASSPKLQQGAAAPKKVTSMYDEKKEEEPMVQSTPQLGASSLEEKTSDDADTDIIEEYSVR